MVTNYLSLYHSTVLLSLVTKVIRWLKVTRSLEIPVPNESLDIYLYKRPYSIFHTIYIRIPSSPYHLLRVTLWAGGLATRRDTGRRWQGGEVSGAWETRTDPRAAWEGRSVSVRALRYATFPFLPRSFPHPPLVTPPSSLGFRSRGGCDRRELTTRGTGHDRGTRTVIHSASRLIHSRSSCRVSSSPIHLVRSGLRPTLRVPNERNGNGRRVRSEGQYES